MTLLVATMLSERSANLMSLADAPPRSVDRIGMRYQWIVREQQHHRIAVD